MREESVRHELSQRMSEWLNESCLSFVRLRHQRERETYRVRNVFGISFRTFARVILGDQVEDEASFVISLLLSSYKRGSRSNLRVSMSRIINGIAYYHPQGMREECNQNWISFPRTGMGNNKNWFLPPNFKYLEKLGLQSRRVGGAVAGTSMGVTGSDPCWSMITSPEVVTRDPDRDRPSVLILSKDPGVLVHEV